MAPHLSAQEVVELKETAVLGQRYQVVPAPAQPSVPAIGTPGLAPHFQEPPQSLRLAIQRHSAVKFAGIRVVEYRERGRTQTFTQRVLRDGQNIRIEFPSDSPYFGQIIVERGPVRFHYVPGHSEILQQPAMEDEALNRLLQAVDRKVMARVSAGSAIAGRATDLVTIERDRNQQYRLWIDRQQGTILRRQILDRSGRCDGYYEYQSIDYNARIPRDAFQIKVSGVQTVTTDQQLIRLARRLEVKPYRLRSTQWELTGVGHLEIKQLGPGGSDFRMLVTTYAHGWHRVRLFQYKGVVDGQRLTMLLEPHLRSHIWSKDGYTFVLLGELSTQDLERMSGTLRG